MLTEGLLSVGRSLNLPVLDHLILGNGSFVSLRQVTELWNELPHEEKAELLTKANSSD